MITVEGTIEKILYHEPESHYTVVVFRVRETGSRISVTGHLPGPAPGEALRIEGRWRSHPRYGQQFAAEGIREAAPITESEMRRYLASGAIPGIGPRMADRLTAAFGSRTLETIETAPERLQEIEGIGAARAAAIHQNWLDRRGLRRLMDFLAEIGVSGAYGARIFRRYGTESIEIMSGDPLRLVEDLPRIGFVLADAVIRRFDLFVDPVERAGACIRHLLHLRADQGHVCDVTDALLSQCRDRFSICEEEARQALEKLCDDGEVVKVDNADGRPGSTVYLRSYFDAEIGIARRLWALLSTPSDLQAVAADPIAEAVVRRHAICPSEEQRRIISSILEKRVGIITGGPGTGKTTLIRSLAAVLESFGKQTLLAAPTGRASRRMAEVVRRPASTLHKLLEYRPGEEVFGRNRDRPLQAAAVIVDEASMIDTLLMDRLLDALPASGRVVFVGDIFQLPAVGPGNVLSDMIESGKVPVFHLTEVFRQEKESPIVLNAHRIRRGAFPELSPGPGPSPEAPFCFLEADGQEGAEAMVAELCRHIIPERFGLDPVREIQVVCPMHKGLLGTIHLNQRLQKILNPDSEGLVLGGLTLKAGDKVMHLKNDYEKEVFNGEIGVVSFLDPAVGNFEVVYDGRGVDYRFSEVDRIGLAYAVTVHKSQGSEYPAVVIPLTRQHRPMLQRNLIYTAVTRARTLVVLVGSRRALDLAVDNDRSVQRMTGLADRLAAIKEVDWSIG
jgi:exodeoxyribonuclease V alpha subunit